MGLHYGHVTNILSGNLQHMLYPSVSPGSLVQAPVATIIHKVFQGLPIAALVLEICLVSMAAFSLPKKRMFSIYRDLLCMCVYVCACFCAHSHVGTDRLSGPPARHAASFIINSNA